MSKRFFQETFSLGVNHTATQILYTVCDLIAIKSFPIFNLTQSRNALVSALQDVDMLQYNKYQKLSGAAQADIRTRLAALLVAESPKYICNPVEHDKDSKREWVLIEDGIRFNRTRDHNKLSNTSVMLPEAFFEQKVNLVLALKREVEAINKEMDGQIAAAEESRCLNSHRCG